MNTEELQLAVTETAETEITISDAATREIACNFLKAVKARIKQVTEFWSEPKKKAADAHKAICEQEKKFLQPLRDAEAKVKEKIGVFDLAERKRLQEEEERRRQDAMAAMSLAVEAEKSGNTAAAREAIAIAAMESAQVEVVPKSAGVTTRYEWRARVVDPILIPRMFLMVDEKALQAYAKSTKGKSVVPGVEFYEVPIVGAKAV